MEDTKHSAAQVLPPRAQTRTAAGCGTRHCCILYTLSIAVRNLTAQSCSKAQLARRARAVQQSPPRRTRVRVKRHRRDATRPHCCECERHRRGTLHYKKGTPSETMHANFSNCGAEGWLAPTGACAAPAWARWPYLEPWVATIAFFVWICVEINQCVGCTR